jgi:enoyl-CoA hydratase
MTEPHIHVRIAPRPPGGVVGWVSVANPGKLNVLDSALMLRFTAEVEALGRRDDLRALVVTGEGDKAFIGGADIREMGAIASPAEATTFIERLHGACRAVRDCPVPVIARVDGYALGGGLELMAACDLRIASRTARFGMPEVRVGLPSVIEAALLPSLIGWGRTRRLVMLGEIIDAAESLEWGLVEKVVAPEALDAAVEDWLACLDAAGPRAMRIQKALVRTWEGLSPDAGVRAGVSAFAEAFETDEPRRMMAAFLDRTR